MVLCFFSVGVLKSYAEGSVVQFGDSLTSGMAMQKIDEKYKNAGFTVDIPGSNPNGKGGCDGYKNGFPCLGIAQVLPAIDQDRDKVAAATAIVIELGTNPSNADPAFKGQAEQLVDKIKGINGNAKIYWVNLVARDFAPVYSQRNKDLTAVASEKGIIIIDWFHKVFPNADPTNFQNGLADTNNWYASKDEVIHYNAAGYQAMSDTIVSAVLAGGTSSAPAVNGALNGTTITKSSDCIALKIDNPTGDPPYPDWCKQQIASGSGSQTPPSDTGNQMGNLALDLVNVGKEFCPNAPKDASGFSYINSGNYMCFKDHMPNSAVHKDEAYNEIFISNTQVDGHVLQCVGFANTVTAGIYGKAIREASEGGNVIYAFQLAKNLTNYTFINKSANIEPGDMLIWPSSPPDDNAGHIAVVVKVIDKDAGDIVLAEANAPKDGLLRTRNANVSAIGVVGWLRRK
jgi:lysophospholipase L1-like esterase